MIDDFVTKIEHRTLYGQRKDEEKTNEILLLINNPINSYVILMASNIQYQYSIPNEVVFVYFCVYCIRCKEIKMGVKFKIQEKHEEKSIFVKKMNV